MSTTIYANAYPFADFPLSEAGFKESLLKYAEQAEAVAKQYRQLAKFVSDNSIEIESANGYAYAGQFTVDDSVVDQLKSAGIVEEEGDSDNQITSCFYVDRNLSEVLDDMESEFDEIFGETSQLRGSYNAIEKTLEELDEELDNGEERSEIVHLEDLISEFDRDEDPTVGEMEISVSKLEDGAGMLFNLTVPDVGESPTSVELIREEGVFKFKCHDCDEWHLASLEACFDSLVTASLVIANLAVMVGASRELSTALIMIDQNMRVLQELIKFDYAVRDARDRGPVDDRD